MLNRSFLILLLGMCMGWFPALALGQDGLAIGSSLDRVVLNKNFSILVEDDGRATLSDVMKKTFVVPSHVIPKFGYTAKVIWLKFRLRNDTKTPIRRWLEIDIAGLGHYALYRARDQKLLEDGGQSVAGPAQVHRNPVIPMAIEAFEDDTYYLRLQSQYSLTILLYLHTQESLNHVLQREGWLFGAYIGFLAFALLSNLFLFITTRSRIFLSFCLLLTSFHGGFFLCNFGITWQYLWHASPWWAERSILIFIELSLIFGNIFVTGSLGTKTNAKRLHAGLRVIPIVSLFCLGLTMVTMHVVLTEIVITMSGIVLSVYYFAGFYFCFRRYRPAYYFSLAWALLFLSNIIFIMLSTNVLAVEDVAWQTFLTFEVLLWTVPAQAVLLSLGTGDQFNGEMSKLNTLLKHHITNVEAIVTEKTQKIRSLFHSVKLGIFTIEHSGRIEEMYSRNLETILEKENLQDTPALEAMFAQSDLSQDERSRIANALNACIGEGTLAFELNEACFPREFTLDLASGRKNVEVDWIPIPDDEQAIQKMLITMRDVTESRRLSEESRLSRENLSILGELADVKPEFFLRFVRQARESIDRARSLLDSAAGRLVILDETFISMHTLKGLARSLNLRQIAAHIHDVESVLATLRSAGGTADAAGMIPWLDALDNLLNRYEKSYDATFRRKTQSLDEQAILMSTYEVLRRLDDLDAKELRRQLSHLKNDFETLCLTGLQSLLEEINRSVSLLSKDLQKPQPRLELQGGNLQLPHDVLLVLQDVFLHLVRNAMDHGLETAAERLAAGKSAAGLLRLAFSIDTDRLFIDFGDDGRGLNLSRIQDTAQKRNLISHLQSFSDQQIADMIFLADLSTASHTSEISGRGIGMYAVKRMIEDRGGSIRIVLGSTPSRELVPFHFQIELPLFRRAIREAA